MARKPDLGAMAITKARAAVTPAFGNAEAAPAPGGVKSLTVKVDGETYVALRNYCHHREMEQGTRVTHQEVAVQALRSFLGLDA